MEDKQKLVPGELDYDNLSRVFHNPSDMHTIGERFFVLRYDVVIESTVAAGIVVSPISLITTISEYPWKKKKN